MRVTDAFEAVLECGCKMDSEEMSKMVYEI